MTTKTDVPDESLVMINCDGCHKSSYSAKWIGNQGKCPRCGAYFKMNKPEGTKE